MGVILHRLVEGRGDDLAPHGAAHVGHFLGTLADEEDDQVDVVVVGGDAVRDVLQEERLPGLRRRHDEPPLAPADGRDKVDHALREVLRHRLQLDLAVGEDGRQVLEVRAILGDLGVHPVDRFDAEQAVVLLAVLGWPDLARDVVAGAQAEAADLRLGDVHVIGAREHRLAAEEAVSVVDDLQDAAREDVALSFGLMLEEAEDELLLLEGAVAGQAEVFRDVQQLLAGLAFEFCNIHGSCSVATASPGANCREPVGRSGLTMFHPRETAPGDDGRRGVRP